MRRFEIALPSSVDECLQILGRREAAARLVAGGTDLLPQLKNGLLRPAWVVDLSGVSALRILERDGGGGHSIPPGRGKVLQGSRPTKVGPGEAVENL